MFRLPGEHLVGQPLEGLAEHDEATGRIPGAEVQVGQPAAPAAVSPFGGEDDQVEGVPWLHLDPGRSAPADVVRRRGRLDDHTFLSVVEGGGERGLGGRGGVGHGPADPGRVWYGAVERGPTHGAGLVDEVGAVQVQSVKEERAEHTGRKPAGPTGRLLERSRPPCRVDEEGLAVQDGGPSRQRQGYRDDLRNPAGDVVQASAEDTDVVAVAVHLDPDAVELGVDGGR